MDQNESCQQPALALTSLVQSMYSKVKFVVEEFVFILAFSRPVNLKAPAHLLDLAQGLAVFTYFSFLPLHSSGSCISHCPSHILNKA